MDKKVQKLLKKLNKEPKMSNKQRRKAKKEGQRARRRFRIAHAMFLDSNDSYFEETIERDRIVREVQQEIEGA